MDTLATQLESWVDAHGGQPRVYADANLPAGSVAFMRQRLGWDVLFVVEHDDLRRARDSEHYRLARQLRRVLISLDRDFLDDRRFPPAESGGVIVLSAPDERALRRILGRLDKWLRGRAPFDDGLPRDVTGRKLSLHVDWP